MGFCEANAKPLEGLHESVKAVEERQGIRFAYPLPEGDGGATTGLSLPWG